jgi:hypothetical protein
MKNKKKKLPGVAFEDKKVVIEILERASELMSYYDANWSDDDKVSRINYNKLSSELDRILTHDRYYLIHNIWLSRGKKRIDRRTVDLIDRQSILRYLKDNFVAGYEYQFIFIPIKDNSQSIDVSGDYIYIDEDIKVMNTEV